MPLIKIIRLPLVVVLSLTRGSTRGRWEWLSRAGVASAGGRPVAGPLHGAVTALLLLVAAAGGGFELLLALTVLCGRSLC